MNKQTGLVAFLVLAVIIVGAILLTKTSSSPADVANSNTATQSQPTTDQAGDNQLVEAEKTPVADGSYAVQTAVSRAEWSGSKTLIVNYVDSGTIGIKEGSFVVADGAVASGSIAFDMTTIAAEKTGKNAGEDMLTKHLMSKDFFEVETYPTATFVFTKTEKAAGDHQFVVTGDLTIKDVTEEISFPVEAYLQDGSMMVRGSVTLDRTKWNVRYGSDNFFDNLGNNVIDDEFTLTLNVVATAE